MVKRICNHCGKLFSGKRCPCRGGASRHVERQYHNSFYDSPVWRKLSRQVRVRDYNCDRLRLWFVKHGRPADRAGSLLYSLAMTQPMSGVPLLVHHIVPRDEDASLQYTEANLITLSSAVHELVHSLYDCGLKAEVQALLTTVVASPLP